MSKFRVTICIIKLVLISFINCICTDVKSIIHEYCFGLLPSSPIHKKNDHIVLFVIISFYYKYYIFNIYIFNIYFFFFTVRAWHFFLELIGCIGLLDLSLSTSFL